MSERPDNDGFEFDAPARLVDDLRLVSRSHVRVPDDVDEQVLAAARREIPARRNRSRWRSWQPVVAGLGLAAALGIGAWFGGLFPSAAPAPLFPGPMASSEDAAVPRAPLDGDLDANGKIDILDAFALARRIEAGDTRAADDVTGDLNGDGRVGTADVDLLALWAVLLPKGGRHADG